MLLAYAIPLSSSWQNSGQLDITCAILCGHWK